MADQNQIPPPPAGFTAIPAPPEGFALQAPPPPEGFTPIEASSPGIIDTLVQGVKDIPRSEFVQSAAHGIQGLAAGVERLNLPFLSDPRAQGALPEALPQPQPGFQPTTLPEQITSLAIQELPATAAIAATNLPVGAARAFSSAALRAGLSRLPSVAAAVGAAGSTIVTGTAQGGLGSAVRQFEEGKEINATRTFEDTQNALKFSALLALPISAVVGGLARRASIKAEKLQGASPEARPIQAPVTPQVSNEFKNTFDQLLEEEVRLTNSVDKQMSKVASQREGTVKLRIKAEDTLDRAARETAKVEASTQARVTYLQNQVDNLTEDLGQQLKAAEVKSKIEARVFEIQKKLDDARENPPDTVSQLEGKMAAYQEQLQELRQQVPPIRDERGMVTPEGYTRPQVQRDPLKAIDEIAKVEGKQASLIQKIDDLKNEIQFRRDNNLQDHIAVVKDLEDQLSMAVHERGTADILASNDAFAAKRLALQQRNQAKIASIEKISEQRLQKVSDRLSIEQSRLVSERKNLLKQLHLETTLPDSQLNVLRQKLKDNLLRQKQVEVVQKDMPVTITAGRIGKGLTVANTQEELLDIALKQVHKVDEAVAKGFLRPEMADVLKRAEWDNALRLQGIDPGAAATTRPSTFGKILNETTRNNLVQKRTGARVGEVAERAVAGTNQATNYIAQRLSTADPLYNQLNKLGIADDEITRLLQYYEWGPDGQVRFTPTPAKIVTPNGATKLDIPEYNGPDFSNPANAGADAALKQVATFFRQEGQANGAPLLPRYVPLRSRILQTGVSKGTKVSEVLDPTLMQERVSGFLDPITNETNIRTLTTQYIRESARQQFLSPVLTDGINELNKLRLLGANQDAENFKRFLIWKFNLNGEKDIAAIFGQQFVKMNPEVVTSLIKAAPDSATAMQEIQAAANKAMYSNLVGTNPVTWLQQYLQPEIIGIAELGFNFIQIGKKLRFTSPQLLKEAKELVQLSLTHDLQLLDSEIAAAAPKNTLAKGLEFINKPADILSKRTMGHLEIRNRELTMLAAGAQWRSALAKNGLQGVDKVIADLTTAERSLVRKVFKDGGLEEARKMYQVIRTRRINFAYSVADKPEILSEGLGKYIPFTTFSRNLANRMIEDVAEKHYGTLVKRVLTPIIAMGIVQGITGRQLPGTNPVDQVANLVTSSTPFPQYTQPILRMKERGVAAGVERAAEILTPYGPLKRFGKLATGKKGLLSTPEEIARYSATDKIFDAFKR